MNIEIMANNSPPIVRAARAISRLGRTTLGPFGANKLVVEENGNVTLTSSGAVMLDHLDVNHPAATIIRNAAQDIQEQHSDGTSSLLVLTNGLLSGAERLLEIGFHPTTIEQGYRSAMDLAQEELVEKSRPLSTTGTSAVSRTALTSTRDPHIREQIGRKISSIVQKAATKMSDGMNNGKEVSETSGFDRKNISVLTRLGGGQSESQLIEGVVLDYRPLVEGMPQALSEAGVATLSSTLDVPHIGNKTDRRSLNISVESSSFEDRENINKYERASFQKDLKTLSELSCNFIVTSAGINERVESQIASKGILALKQLDEDDLIRVARATGARIVPGIEELEKTGGVGKAEIRVERIAGRDMVIIRSNAGSPVYTLLCRAPDPRSTDAFQSSVESAISASILAEKSENILPGGGAIEMSTAHTLKGYTSSIDDRSRLVIKEFTNALETIPQALVENTGLKRQEFIRLGVAHSQGRNSSGVNAFSGGIGDVLAEDPIVEPLELKLSIWNAAVDLVIKLIRVDAELPASDLDDTDIQVPGEA